MYVPSKNNICETFCRYAEKKITIKIFSDNDNERRIVITEDFYAGILYDPFRIIDILL